MDYRRADIIKIIIIINKMTYGLAAFAAGATGLLPCPALHGAQSKQCLVSLGEASHWARWPSSRWWKTRRWIAPSIQRKQGMKFETDRASWSVSQSARRETMEAGEFQTRKDSCRSSLSLHLPHLAGGSGFKESSMDGEEEEDWRTENDDGINIVDRL